MLHSIENHKFICKIESVGAEIRSLKCKSTGKEYIWQINPSVWGSSSPVLFPSIGKIKDGKLIYKAKDYKMTKHGIVRDNDCLDFKYISTAKCSFTLMSSEETKIKYPYDFRFLVSYELLDNRLVMTYEIENKDKETMLFSCGGHTAYRIHLDTFTSLSDYVIEFPNKTQLTAETLGGSGLLSYKQRNYQLTDNYLALSDTIFNEDALIFEDVDVDWVRLRKKHEKKGVVVSFKGYPNLALWSKPKANYVCIEPWLGLPDRQDESTLIKDKKTYYKLNALEKFSISITTEIES